MVSVLAAYGCSSVSGHGVTQPTASTRLATASAPIAPRIVQRPTASRKSWCSQGCNAVASAFSPPPTRRFGTRCIRAAVPDRGDSSAGGLPSWLKSLGYAQLGRGDAGGIDDQGNHDYHQRRTATMNEATAVTARTHVFARLAPFRDSRVTGADARGKASATFTAMELIAFLAAV